MLVLRIYYCVMWCFSIKQTLTWEWMDNCICYTFKMCFLTFWINSKVLAVLTSPSYSFYPSPWLIILKNKSLRMQGWLNINQFLYIINYWGSKEKNWDQLIRCQKDLKKFSVFLNVFTSKIEIKINLAT